MFVGHYGISFAAKSMQRSVPLWVFFIAVQLLDVLWAPFVLIGIEKVRIVPGITATNPLDLYHMPYTHSLVAAVIWSAVAFAVSRAAGPSLAIRRGAAAVAAAVFSHWVLDLVVHRPDLPIYDNRWKVGLGLWNRPMLALGTEGALLAVGVVLYLRRASMRARVWTVAFVTMMLVAHIFTFFGAPPSSPAAAAVTALAAYAVFAGGARLLDSV